MMVEKAVVRKPSKNFQNGITSADMGAPIIRVAQSQHDAYCRVLRECGVDVMVLEADQRFPDSTFIEDTAVLTEECAVIANPGEVTRRGEVAYVEKVLAESFPKIEYISTPGTLDGGDVCRAEDHFYIGLSGRTNLSGARQLENILAREGYTSSLIPLADFSPLLHLKSGIAYIGDNVMVAHQDFASLEQIKKHKIIWVKPDQAYAANCVRVNNFVLIAEGYPRVKKMIKGQGFNCIVLSMSEFQKMDGGLSCLSLRF